MYSSAADNGGSGENKAVPAPAPVQASGPVSPPPPPFPSPPAAASDRPLPAPTRPQGAWWGWLGLHGGAGVSTLVRALPGGFDLNRQLPEKVGYPGLPIVGVCRSHASGLHAAQKWAAETTEHRQHLDVLGLIVVADAPGKLPRPLARMVRLIGGGWPHVWQVPWVPAWRLGDEPSQENTPPVLRHLLRDLFERVQVPLPQNHQGR